MKNSTRYVFNSIAFFIAGNISVLVSGFDQIKQVGFTGILFVVGMGLEVCAFIAWQAFVEEVKETKTK